MLKKKITRKEFLKAGFMGILAMLAIPILKLFAKRDKVSHKDAKYYKELAG